MREDHSELGGVRAARIAEPPTHRPTKDKSPDAFD